MTKTPQRVPRPSLHQRPSDPFSNGESQKSAGVDAALCLSRRDATTTGSSSKSSSTSPHKPSSADRDALRFTKDQLASSPSLPLPDSSFDVSIGDRPASTEQLGHTACHSLEGSLLCGHDSITTQPEGEEWDHIMEGTSSLASFSTAWDKRNHVSGVTNVKAVWAVQQDGEEAVEVIAGANTSDYLNSSLARFLESPEEKLFPSFEGEPHPSASVASIDSHNVAKMQMYNAAIEFLKRNKPSVPQDSSILSSTTPNINASFSSNDLANSSLSGTRNETDDSTDIQLLIPPIYRTPSRRCLATPSRNDSKDASLPNISSLALSPIGSQAGSEAGRRVLLDSTNLSSVNFPLHNASPSHKCQSPPSIRSRPHLVSLKPESPAGASCANKSSTGKQDDTRSIIDFSLSPIAARAGSEAERMLRADSLIIGVFNPFFFDDGASPIRKRRSPLRPPNHSLSRDHDHPLFDVNNSSSVETSLNKAHLFSTFESSAAVDTSASDSTVGNKENDRDRSDTSSIVHAVCEDNHELCTILPTRSVSLSRNGDNLDGFELHQDTFSPPSLDTGSTS